MRVVKEFNKGELNYDNLRDTSGNEYVEVYGEIIKIDYESIIDSQFTGGNTGDEFEKIKKELNMGFYSKAPCGGFVNFFSVIGDKGNNYIIYSGVNEVSNSHYMVTIHKILIFT